MTPLDWVVVGLTVVVLCVGVYVTARTMYLKPWPPRLTLEELKELKSVEAKIKKLRENEAEYFARHGVPFSKLMRQPLPQTLAEHDACRAGHESCRPNKIVCSLKGHPTVPHYVCLTEKWVFTPDGGVPCDTHGAAPVEESGKLMTTKEALRLLRKADTYLPSLPDYDYKAELRRLVEDYRMLKREREER